MSAFRNRSRAGFTMTELIVVVGILVMFASLVLPMVSTMRTKALKVDCAANLRQLHQALSMYSVDNSRLYETYPPYVSTLFANPDPSANYTIAEKVNSVVGYVRDARVFICPADGTKATKNANGVASLKPYYSGLVPADNKSSWAERYVNGGGQVNCSYLYEFSGRTCTTYTYDDGGGTDDDPNSFVSGILNAADDPSFYPALNSWVDYSNPDTPVVVPGADRSDSGFLNPPSYKGVVTWQDAKFFQLEYGDQYRYGASDATTLGGPPPPPGFDDPIDYYYNNAIDPSQYLISYPRTWMPILRCFWHQTPVHVDDEGYEEVQNISLDGTIFNSSPYWERTCFKYGSKVDLDPAQ